MDRLRKKLIYQRHQHEKGQVMVLALLVILILAMAIIFLVDLSSVIKSKMRGQTAADAAAMAGARWQMHSLNMAGELNLVKATTLLITDIEPFDDETVEGVKTSCDNISRMQSRIIFVGPMIGFGAAQQAARNNGLYSNPAYGSVMKIHREQIENEEGAYAEVPDQIPIIEDETMERFGYLWKNDYVAMIEQMESMGVAIGSNASFVTMEVPTFLYSASFYRDVNSRNWCGLRDVLENEVFDESGNDTFDGLSWWPNYITDEPPNVDFNKECEYMPLNVEFTSALMSGEREYYGGNTPGIPDLVLNELENKTLLSKAYDQYNPTDEEGEPVPEDTDGRINPIPYIQWLNYDTSWTGFVPREEFCDGTWLRSELSKQYWYGGAVAVFSAQIRPETISGVWNWKAGQNLQELKAENGTYIGDTLDDVDQDIGERIRSDEQQLRQGLGSINTIALAKPLGGLEVRDDENNKLAPCDTNLVLPAFDKVSVMPSAIDPRPSSQPNWEMYAWNIDCLPELKARSAAGENPEASLADFKAWVREKYAYTFEPQLKALELFNNPAFRKDGYDWLNMVIKVPMRDDEGNLVYDDEGNVIYIEEFRKENCDPPGKFGESGDAPPHVGS